MEKFRPGGVILFDWAGNVSGASQVAALTTGLREAAAKAGNAPLMIGVDQENGLVSRLKSVVTTFPGASDIGKTRKLLRTRATSPGRPGRSCATSASRSTSRRSPTSTSTRATP